MGRGVARDGRPEDLGEAGEGHLVGVAGSSNALEVEDEEGQHRAAVCTQGVRKGGREGGEEERGNNYDGRIDYNICSSS